ncbi:Vacuolar protein sorting-associated protein 70 [Paramarasmius palmivorus]|uniref:Vacuolar protein sorting-associated protein 70 n=1 Tax=Paramarasmius palmivorus TaxID=297713 RepID=A0AAW0CFP9_9AGAR
MSGKLGVPYDGKGKEIPVPITNRPPQSTRSRRFRQLAGLVVVLLGVHYAVNGFGFGGGRDKQDLNALDMTSHPRHPKKGRYIPPVLAEKHFLEVPDADSAIKASRHYAGRPHLAGSEADFEQAKDFLSFLQSSLGIKAPHEQPIYPAGSPESQRATLSIPKLRAPHAWIDVYYPVMNTPLDRTLQALDDNGEVVWEADLDEHGEDGDPDAAKYSNAVPTFHGLSSAGDVKGQLVYANYGLKEDYDGLVAKGIDFNGKIVLVRYGGNFRGLKIKGAEELGAAGVLIYSDPRDDGSVTVENGYKPYPEGPARNAKAVQRGSVQYLSLYPGDPTTPGYPSYENSTRTDGENIPKIPSLPISWENAKKLLDLLDGKEWNGVVRLSNQVDTKVTPIWNTVGVIPGHIRDEIVVLGNHRDAWVLGAADPTSGTASIHETIRGFGELLKKGWKPMRTIVFASWDAEEYGLIGSTEWGEDFAEFISKYVVAYLNLDVSTSGSRFNTQASPLLSHVVRHAADDLPHPTKENATLWDATKDTGDYFGITAQTVDEEYLAVRARTTNTADDIGVGVLGSGSDYTVFLQRLGVPSMNHGFGASTHDPVYHYHSVYDSELFQERYADPGFHRHIAIAKHLGLTALRIASPAILPFNTTHYSLELDSYLDKVEAIISTTDIQVDLSPLRQSIGSLQVASRALDFERLAAERELWKIIKKWKKKHDKGRRLKKKMWKAYCKWQKEVLGKECKHHHSHGKDITEVFESEIPRDLPAVHPESGKPVKHRVGRLPAWVAEQMDAGNSDLGEGWKDDVVYGLAMGLALSPDPEIEVSLANSLAMFSGGCRRRERIADGHRPHRPHWPGKLIRELIRVVKRLRAINQQLIAFERGFISEDGIPQREWYKHLGVAPGKWLGYGATTLPALTEAITFEKNATLAQYEVGRLKDVVDGLTETVKRLLAAAREDNEEMLLEVFEAGGFDINFQDGLGNTALHNAVMNGSTDVLEHILSHEECDVDPINRTDKATPLHLAVKLEDPELRAYVVSSLLEAGADTKIKNKYNQTALDLVPSDDADTRALIRKSQAQATVSTDDVASDDDGEPGSGSGSDDD